jgi:hypothetical protein
MFRMIAWQVQSCDEVWSVLGEIIKAPAPVNIERLSLCEVVGVFARQLCSGKQVRGLLGQNRF